ncbi:substrate-binding domain-containing protein [Opitutus sp. ER46]|uniref:substrate-binding domain-containing protein n=1 Tax=Opitutus sp. ER46 TaxID=2161864 RepID=UPI000D3195A0|nr:substrate-binding domain-containing protein [Opitutus sp. ER46]PTX91383.1 hypothetical protein DB354_15930 [Opitutus sp. ER46]
MAASRKRVQKPRPGRLRVAVCIDTRDGPGRERLLGVYEYAVQRNWNLLLVRQDDAAGIERVIEMKVDGAILFDRSRHFHRQLRKHGVFCVETSARNLELDDAAVFVDDAAVGTVAAQHLESLGLEHFAYCGPDATHPPSVRRAASFAARLREKRFTVDTFAGVSATGDSQLSELSAWLRGLPKPTGILAFDDKIAERILAACRWAGLAVPEEIALVGAGNDELICELVEPGLSSVCIPTREIGRLAAEAIDAHYQGRAVPAQRSLPPTEVVIRASSERLLVADPKVVAAIELIRARAHCPFGTDQIVDTIGIPRRTLERRFLASTGRTIHDFIIEFRLALAKQLLRRTHNTISEVARQSGYAALSAFTRMFVERVGCHPDAYRKRSHAL